MNYNKLLDELIKNVKFSRYDSFSTEKYCHYIKYKDNDYALIWQKVNKEEIDTKLENLSILQSRINKCVKDGARIPRLLAISKDDNHIFQLQEKVKGKKDNYYEILDQKTTVEDFVELLITFDIMNLNGITVDSGRNCVVDDDGHISFFDFTLSKIDERHNAKPELFKRLVFREPYDYTEDDLLVLKRILEKWIMACTKYFSMCNMDREDMLMEIELTIHNYSFMSKEEKRKLINDIFDKTLQKSK